MSGGAFTPQAANLSKIAAASASASGGSVLKWNLLCRSSWLATKLAPTTASTTLPFVFVLATFGLSRWSAGTLSYKPAHHQFPGSSLFVPRKLSMRANSIHFPSHHAAPKLKDREILPAGFRESHTMRYPFWKKRPQRNVKGVHLLAAPQHRPKQPMCQAETAYGRSTSQHRPKQPMCQAETAYTEGRRRDRDRIYATGARQALV